jgi:hypothetical protein
MDSTVPIPETRSTEVLCEELAFLQASVWRAASIMFSIGPSMLDPSVG